MPESVAAPRAQMVKVCGGTREVVVRKWSMEMHDLLRPKLVDLFEKAAEIEQGGTALGSVAQLLFHLENEMLSITRMTVELPDDLEWKELDLEDAWPLMIAVWETCLVGGDGSEGYLGKLNALSIEKLGVNLGQWIKDKVSALVALFNRFETLASEVSSTTSSSSQGSPSSHIAGARRRKKSGKR